MTKELQAQLIQETDLSKYQVNNATANALVDYFTSHDDKLLKEEALRQAEESRKIVDSMQSDYETIKKQFEEIAFAIKEISETQDEFGALTDERAKNALTLFASLLRIIKKMQVDDADAVGSTSYILYAYLGGQARQQVLLADKAETPKRLEKAITRLYGGRE